MELLTLDNYHTLQPWLKNYGWREYNSNIVTMLMWNVTYPMYFEIFDHFALTCFEYNNKKHWLMPYSEKEYLKEALDTLLVCSKKYDIFPSLHGVTLEAKKQLEVLFPNEIYFEYHERAGDYVYDRKQQETLSGKKMQKRRNHFNAFLKEYQNRYIYKPLEKEDFPSIYELLESWKESKDESEYESIEHERTAIDFLFEHFDVLDLKGGCIYIDGKLEAFNIASEICEDMIQIHIEKANRNIRGLYVAIIKFLLESLDDKIIYVNREDDMGSASLRKAKHDMRPIYKERKHLAVFDSICIRQAEDCDIEEMKSLWIDSFEDENKKTTEFFFTHIMRKEHAYVICNSTHIMGMAFINIWNMDTGKTAFLEGVCTRKEYQGCGIMKKLVSHILSVYKEYEVALQAYNWDIYKSLGFQETHYLKECIFTSFSENNVSWNSINPEEMAIIYQNYTVDKKNYRLHDASYYKDFFIPYMHACSMHIRQCKEGYACFYESEEYIIVPTIHYTNKDTFYAMLSSLHKEFNKPIKVTTDTKTEEKGTLKIALMTLSDIKDEDNYINEII